MYEIYEEDLDEDLLVLNTGAADVTKFFRDFLNSPRKIQTSYIGSKLT